MTETIEVIKLLWPDEVKFGRPDYGLFINDRNISIHLPFLKKRLKLLDIKKSYDEIVKSNFYFKYKETDMVFPLKIYYVSILYDIVFVEQAHMSYERAIIYIEDELQ